MTTVPDTYYLAEVQGHVYERRKARAVLGGFLYHVVELGTRQRVGSHYGWSIPAGRRRQWSWSLAPPGTPGAPVFPGPDWAACVAALLAQAHTP